MKTQDYKFKIVNLDNQDQTRTGFFALPQSARAKIQETLNPKKRTTRGRTGIFPKHVIMNPRANGYGKKPNIISFSLPYPASPSNNHDLQIEVHRTTYRPCTFQYKP